MKTIMLTLSRWAKSHVWLSRIFVVIGNLALIGLACLVGEMTRSLNLVFQSFWLTGAIVCAGVLGICYPRPFLQRKNRGFYARQKRFDIGLLSIGFFLFIVESNRQFTDILNVQQIFAIHRVAETNSIELDSCSNEKLVEIRQFMADKEFQTYSKKEKKQYLKSQVKELKRNSAGSDVGNVGLALLGILLGALIIMGAASLSCSLACSGATGMAYVVLAMGVAGGIAVAVALIKAGSKQKIKQPEVETIIERETTGS